MRLRYAQIISGFLPASTFNLLLSPYPPPPKKKQLTRGAAAKTKRGGIMRKKLFA